MADWKKTKCGTCVYQRKKPICNSCLRFQLYRPMTNAERIRSMSDEELAEFISKYFSCEYECAARDKCGSDWDCKRATIDWLQSEVE